MTARYAILLHGRIGGPSQSASAGLQQLGSHAVGSPAVVAMAAAALLDHHRRTPAAAMAVGEGPAEDEAPMDKKELKEEVLNTAKMLGTLSGFKLLMLDTENKFVSTGVAKEIAAAAQGKYSYVPKANEKAVGQVASQAIAEMRG